jgi:hypothetical protein
MNPLVVARNLTPSSTAFGSCCVTTEGTCVSGQIEHGQFRDGAGCVVKLAGGDVAAGLVDVLPAASADLTR